MIAVAVATRLYRLDSQLWIDEISALSSIRRPGAEILTQWPGAASHILYEFLAHLSLGLLGESPIAIRLPAVLFGILGVVALWALVRPRLGASAALTVAGLFALSYHHVFYSQNARGYTALIFFSLAATALLDRFVRTRRVPTAEGIAYAVSAALAAYVQPFGLMLLPGHALAVLLAHALEGRGERPAPVPTRTLLFWIAGAIGLVGVLYAPFARSILTFGTERSGIASEGSTLGLAFLVETIQGLAAGFGGLVGLAIAGAIGLVGVFVWLRRAPVVFAALVGPLVLQTGVFAALGASVHPRYYALALPIVYAVGAVGLLTVIAAAAGRLPWAARTRETVLRVGVTALVVLSAVALVPYYRYPKQDYLGALEALQRLSRPEDPRAGVYLAGHVLRDYYGADVGSIENDDELFALERSSGRPIWLVTTLETILGARDPALLEHIRTGYERVEYLPGTVGDGGMRIYRSRDGAPGA